jgi:hypothetical protein
MLTVETKENLFSSIVNLRPFYGPKLFNLLYRRKEYTQLDTWNTVKHYSMKDFDKVLNGYEYKYDLLHGLLDSSFDPRNPEYFFEDLKKGRDCDDFARIWRMWAEENDFLHVDEVIVTDIRKFSKRAHVVSIGQDNKGQYWLFDYHYFGPYSNFTNAIEKMYHYYDKEYFIYKIYDYHKETY